MSRSSSGVYIEYTREKKVYINRRNLIMNTAEKSSEISINSPSGVHLILQFHLQSISFPNKFVGMISQSRKECFFKDPRVVVKD